jgi:ABC-type transport system involved in multi-copper enzyme maturation permease subunit
MSGYGPPYKTPMPTPTDALLRYRPWTGELRPPAFASVAMARFALRLLLRRKLFWAVYSLAALVFFFYFYMQYLVVWVQQQAADKTAMVAGVPVRISEFTKFLDRFNLNGTAHTFANFIWFEGYVAMIVLALAGAVLVGNDFHHGSLPFYLSKPIGRRHYVLGKVLGVGAFVNLITTLPALVLFIQAGLLYDWRTYYLDNWRLLVGILGYGAVLTTTLGLLLVATAVMVRRTVPLVMIWVGVFVLGRALGGFLAEVQRLGPTWRLLDLWNDLYLIGLFLLGADIAPAKTGFDQPPVWQAAAVCAAVCGGSWLYLRRRVRAVEIVS